MEPSELFIALFKTRQLGSPTKTLTNILDWMKSEYGENEILRMFEELGLFEIAEEIGEDELEQYLEVSDPWETEI